MKDGIEKYATLKEEYDGLKVKGKDIEMQVSDLELKKSKWFSLSIDFFSISQKSKKSP